MSKDIDDVLGALAVAFVLAVVLALLWISGPEISLGMVVVPAAVRGW